MHQGSRQRFCVTAVYSRHSINTSIAEVVQEASTSTRHSISSKPRNHRLHTTCQEKRSARTLLPNSKPQNIHHYNATLRSPPQLHPNHFPTTRRRRSYHNPTLRHLLRPLSLRKHNLPLNAQHNPTNLRRWHPAPDKLHPRPPTPTTQQHRKPPSHRQKHHADME